MHETHSELATIRHATLRTAHRPQGYGGAVTSRRVPCAGAVVRDGEGRLLLVRRGREPGRGRWSLPGGRVEPGETAAQAAVREVREETGLHVVAGHLVGRVERPGPDGVTYVIDDLACTVVGGVLAAGDDAEDARFVAAGELAALPLSEGLLDALREWGAVP
jgi:8-oxo-dGTP diphosphatase